MRAFLCICAAGLVASMTGCMSSQGYMMNRSGQTFYDRGNYAQAALQFQKAASVSPYNADYVANLAASLKRQGNLPAAEQTWRRALEINPGHQPSYHGLAQMMIENNKHQEASLLLNSWAAGQPYAAEPHIEIAWLNRELGNSAGAAESLKRAIAISPNHPKAQAALGQYYQDNGRMAEAATMYQQALRADWYQPEVQSRLATLKGFQEQPGQIGQTTQFAQTFGGPTTAGLAFPPQPQVARMQQPQMQSQLAFQQQGQMAFNVPAVQPTYTANMPVNAPAGVFQQQTAGQFASTPYSHGPPAPAMQFGQIPNGAQQMAQAPVFQNTMAAQQPVFQQPAMPPQPAVTEYPTTGAVMSGPYPVQDPFADQFISQPHGGVPTMNTQPLNVGPQPGPVPVPIPSTTAIPATPGLNADPAHVPQVSAVPEVQPF